MSCAKSTLTRCTGGIIRPVLVKYRETSCPRSARFAIDSAETRFLRLEVFFIKLSLLLGCLPQRDQVVVFAVGVLSDFENDRVESTAHPTRLSGMAVFRQSDSPTESKIRPSLSSTQGKIPSNGSHGDTFLPVLYRRLERMPRNAALRSEAALP